MFVSEYNDMKSELTEYLREFVAQGKVTKVINHLLHIVHAFSFCNFHCYPTTKIYVNLNILVNLQKSFELQIQRWGLNQVNFKEQLNNEKKKMRFEILQRLVQSKL